MVNVITVSHSKREMYLFCWALQTLQCFKFDDLWTRKLGHSKGNSHTQFGRYRGICFRELKEVLEPLVEGSVILWASYVNCPPL